jgi:hypothetical protein
MLKYETIFNILLFNHLFMAIGASHGAALHVLVTTHALEMIRTLEPYSRFPLCTIAIDCYRLMTFAARGGRSFSTMVVAARTIIDYFGMGPVREFNRLIYL